MRIAFFLAGGTGHTAGVLRALHRAGHDLLVVCPTLPVNAETDTKFGDLRLTELAEVEYWDTPPDPELLVERVRAFAPDATVTVSWTTTPAYRAVARSLPPIVVRFLIMDNMWRAIRRQWLGRASHRWYVDPLFDAVLVPGDRQEFYARRLGFGSADIVRGSLTADTDLFTETRRGGTELAERRRFLYVGRLAWHKGADVLIEAYEQARARLPGIWELHVAGIGELEYLLTGRDGVVMHGFTPPEQVRELMLESSALVVPSHVEPYGVVVHEATLCGLPLLCTDFAGAAPGLVQDGYNGWTVPAADVGAWTDALIRMASLEPDRLESMSRVSRSLSRRLNSDQWAQNLAFEIERRRAAGGGRLSIDRRLFPKDDGGRRLRRQNAREG